MHEMRNSWSWYIQHHRKGTGVLGLMFNFAMLASFLLMDVDLVLGTEQALMLHSVSTSIPKL